MSGGRRKTRRRGKACRSVVVQHDRYSELWAALKSFTDSINLSKRSARLTIISGTELTSSASSTPMYRLLISIRFVALLSIAINVFLNSSGEVKSSISSPLAPKHGRVLHKLAARSAKAG